MTVQLLFNSTGVIIKGDEQILEKAQKGNGNLSPQSVSIEGMTVDADTLTKLHNKALYEAPITKNVDGEDVLAGYPVAKQYASLKQAFIKQQELALANRDKPTESHAPAITTASTK